MTCPYHAAWSDVATADETAHGLAECANRGRCDRLSGQCVCDAGFEGQSCERRSCPKKCSGHGKCQSIGYYATTKDPGEGTVWPYTGVWDADMMYGCVCDAGYSGPDCSERLCPVGDDPMTAAQIDEEQTVLCAATSGTFSLAFRGFTTAQLPVTATAAAVKAALEALPSVYSAFGDAVQVTYAAGVTQACTSAGHTWFVEFLQDFGDLPLLVASSAALQHLTPANLQLVVIQTLKGTKEAAVCSGRGQCDTKIGVCECEVQLSTLQLLYLQHEQPSWRFCHMLSDNRLTFVCVDDCAQNVMIVFYKTCCRTTQQ
jgi:EGF-like domain